MFINFFFIFKQRNLWKRTELINNYRLLCFFQKESPSESFCLGHRSHHWIVPHINPSPNRSDVRSMVLSSRLWQLSPQLCIDPVRWQTRNFLAPTTSSYCSQSNCSSHCPKSNQGYLELEEGLHCCGWRQPSFSIHEKSSRRRDYWAWHGWFFQNQLHDNKLVLYEVSKYRVSAEVCLPSLPAFANSAHLSSIQCFRFAIGRSV